MADQTGSGGADPPQRNEYLPPDIYAARITGTRETLAKVLQETGLDFGCRPHARLNPDGSATLQVYATEARIAELQAAGYQVERGENVSALDQSPDIIRHGMGREELTVTPTASTSADVIARR
jgi:hypothetical protein